MSPRAWTTTLILAGLLTRNPQGMARDIAAMKDKGIGGVMHMQTVRAQSKKSPSSSRSGTYVSVT
jgi:hypothetical protein